MDIVTEITYFKWFSQTIFLKILVLDDYIRHQLVFFFLAVLGFCCCTWLSLIAESGGSSWLRGLLIVVAPPVAEHGL